MEGEGKTELRKMRNRIKDATAPFIPDANVLIDMINEKGFEPDELNPRIFDVIHCAMLRYRENMIDDESALKYRELFKAANKAADRKYFTKKQAARLLTWTKPIEERCTRILNKEPVVNAEELEEEAEKHDPDGPRRLRIAETVLSRRTNQIALVLERCFNDLNQQAVLRTAECLGIQYIYVVQLETSKRKHIVKKLTKGNDNWLTIKKYNTTAECIEGLRKDGRIIWATDLSADSVSLESHGFEVPPKVAIVMGNETVGVSKEMLEAAEKRIYLPIHGFSESLNLSVASALVLQKMFYLCPDARGNLTEEEKNEIRKDWYGKLAKNDKHEALYKMYLDAPPPILEDLRRCEHFQNNQSWVDKSVHKRKREELASDIEQPKKQCVSHAESTE